MLVLFDQGTPVPLRKLLSRHTVETAYERGWSTLENGLSTTSWPRMRAAGEQVAHAVA